MRTGSRWNGARRWILVAAGVFLAPLALVDAATAVLDFENLPAGTMVTTQFLSRGVRFASGFLADHPAAHSGTRVLRSLNPNQEVFTAIPLKMEFVSPQRHVRLFAMSPGAARKGTLRVFDSSGAVIAHDGPKLIAADKFTTMFAVNVAVPRIKRAELRIDGAAHFAIDDLEFGTSPLNTARVVEERQPAARDNVAVNGNFPTVFRLGRPPASTASGTPEADEEEAELNLENTPVLEKDIDPGTSAEITKQIDGRRGLFGSVRWIGTSAPLRVKLSLNGSSLANGKTYGLGGNRGGANVAGVANTGGNVKLSVTNISGVRVKVRLILTLAKG